MVEVGFPGEAEESLCSRSVRSMVSGPCEISFLPSSIVAWAIRVTVGGIDWDIGLSELCYVAVLYPVAATLISLSCLL